MTDRSQEELDRLVQWLAREIKPDVVHLSNALLLGLARVLGPDHPHTLTTRKNLARWTGQA